MGPSWVVIFHQRCHHCFQCTEASIQLHTHFPGRNLPKRMDELIKTLFTGQSDLVLDLVVANPACGRHHHPFGDPKKFTAQGEPAAVLSSFSPCSLLALAMCLRHFDLRLKKKWIFPQTSMVCQAWAAWGGGPCSPVHGLGPAVRGQGRPWRQRTCEMATET